MDYGLKNAVVISSLELILTEQSTLCLVLKKSLFFFALILLA